MFGDAFFFDALRLTDDSLATSEEVVDCFAVLVFELQAEILGFWRRFVVGRMARLFLPDKRGRRDFAGFHEALFCNQVAYPFYEEVLLLQIETVGV